MTFYLIFLSGVHLGGAVYGAYLGLAAIPPEWQAGLWSETYYRAKTFHIQSISEFRAPSAIISATGKVSVICSDIRYLSLFPMLSALGLA